MEPDNGYTFKLFVAGRSPRSTAAEKNLRNICSGTLGDGCRIEVIDIVERPVTGPVATLGAALAAPAAAAPADRQQQDGGCNGLHGDRHPAVHQRDVPLERTDQSRQQCHGNIVARETSEWL